MGAFGGQDERGWQDSQTLNVNFSRGNPSCSPCRGMAPEFEEYFNEIVVSDAPLHFVKSGVGLDSQDGVDTSLGAAVVE